MLLKTALKNFARPTRLLHVTEQSLPVVALKGLAAGLIMALASMSSLAQTASTQPQAVPAPRAITVLLTQSKVVTATDGRERLVDAAAVKPGDIVEYKAVYTNNTQRTVSGLQADLPIPEGLEYLPRSAKPGAEVVKAAALDGAFAAEPLVRKVGSRTETVPYADYRALRWTLGDLPARGELTVTARAKVETIVPPATRPAVTSLRLPSLSPSPLADIAGIGGNGGGGLGAVGLLDAAR